MRYISEFHELGGKVAKIMGKDKHKSPDFPLRLCLQTDLPSFGGSNRYIENKNKRRMGDR